MGIKDKLATAKKTRWPAEGFTDEEVNKIVGRALKKGRRMRDKLQKEQGQAEIGTNREMEVALGGAEKIYDRGRVNQGAHAVFFWKVDCR